MRYDQQTYQRGLSAALLGGAVQLAVALILLVLGLWLGSRVVIAATWHAFGGLGIWIMLAVIYQQYRMVRLEALEADELRQTQGADSSIFESAADELTLAQRRLERLQTWGLPIISLLTAGYLIVAGAWLALAHRPLLGADAMVRDTLDPDPLLAMIVGAPAIERPGFVLALLMGLWFLTFVIARYFAGMTRQSEWSLLRGGAGYLMGSSILAVVLAIGYGLLFLPSAVVLKYLAVAIPLLMVLLGAEMAINLVLNIYRPRKPGQMPKPAFDSRLLSLLTTPESIARSINEALNYQFGFEVSRSWFWQLFSRAFGYLVLLGMAVLIGLSMLVIVEPDQQAVVTRFGSLTGEPLEPGLHVKAPWPFATATRYNVTGIRQIRIGSAEAGLRPGVPILWTNEHHQGKPIHLITAAPAHVDQEDDARAAAPSISLVNTEVFIHYRIGDVMQYTRSATDPDARLAAMGERLLGRYLLRRDVDAWVGPARQQAGRELREQLQRLVDQENLGLEIVDVPVASIHPPQTVADAFHLTVIAEQEKQSAIEIARREATQMLASAAGTVDQAEQISAAAAQLERLRADGAPAEQIARQARQVEQLVFNAGGDAAQRLAQARAERWDKENVERGQVALYQAQLLAFRQARDYYKLRTYLNALAESLDGARKFVLLADRDRLILRGDLTDLGPGLNIDFDAEQ